jgi:molybdopterin-containing oxidoreductase family iron-sulfur binding subunit
VATITDGGAVDTGWEQLVDDARANATLFIAGPRQSEFVRAAARWLNARGNAPVRSIATPAIGADGTLVTLASDIDSGQIDALLVLDVDLVYSAPGDLDIAALLKRVRRLYHHGLHVDATARLAHWHVPATHYLESWSDLRAYDGSASLVQPLIAPLYDGHTAHEMLATLAGDYATPAPDLVRATWPQLDDATWNTALQRGVIDGTAAAPQTASPVRPSAPAAQAAPTLSLVIAPDPYLGDGRSAANLPLTELPRPLSKLVWGNAAEMSAATADKLGVADGDEVELTRGDRSIWIPAFILPGMPDATIAVAAGWGRRTGADDPVGAKSFTLTGAPGELVVTRTGRRAQLISTQEHHAMEGRDLIREVSLADWPGPAPVTADQPTLLQAWDEPEEAWGMSIDLGSCIGCNACVVACLAENNSPIVGKDQVMVGREMHWLRIDQYYFGEPEDAETYFQPVLCMHCEKAPCEVVCPVGATMHSSEGLNEMIYNRCVGTRFCSNNCPYKVRRFNFFDYNADLTETSPLSLLMNPDVSVRERGVMEKCTYCVQRISEARIGSDVADTPIADGSVMTACEQACPTRAITFGNIHDKASRVVGEKAEPTSYAMLAELGTRPRTTYLSKVRNRG